MMRNLVTAVDVRKWLENKEKTVFIEAGTIVTPAARDEARDNGIEIVEGSADPKQPAALCRPDSFELNGIDQAVIARIVEEVVAALGQQRTTVCEVDPCGFKLVRSERLSWDDGNGTVKVKQIFGGKDSPKLEVGLIFLGGTVPVREIRGSEIQHILAGTVNYTVNGREFRGQAGDTAFLPPGAQVGLTPVDEAKLFFVSCQDGWWKNCSR